MSEDAHGHTGSTVARAMEGDRLSHPLSNAELNAMFGDPLVAKHYPPVLTLNQAAELLQVPAETIRNWRSRGLLNDCTFKAGKYVRILRDRLLNHFAN